MLQNNPDAVRHDLGGSCLYLHNRFSLSEKMPSTVLKNRRWISISTAGLILYTSYCSRFFFYITFLIFCFHPKFNLLHMSVLSRPTNRLIHSVKKCWLGRFRGYSLLWLSGASLYIEFNSFDPLNPSLLIYEPYVVPNIYLACVKCLPYKRKRERIPGWPTFPIYGSSLSITLVLPQKKTTLPCWTLKNFGSVLFDCFPMYNVFFSLFLTVYLFPVNLCIVV